MTPTLDKFDDKTATIRITIFLYKNPCSNITKLIHESRVGQKAIYTAIQVLEEAKWIKKTKNTKLPYNQLYSLNEKGKQAAKLLQELAKLLH